MVFVYDINYRLLYIIPIVKSLSQYYYVENNPNKKVYILYSLHASFDYIVNFVS